MGGWEVFLDASLSVQSERMAGLMARYMKARLGQKHDGISQGESLRQVKVPPTPPGNNLLSVNKY